MKRICVFTGTRAEYGILTPVMKQIMKHKMDLHILATGTHCEKEFGYTLNEIYKDFPREIVHHYSACLGDTIEEKLNESAISFVETGKRLLKIQPDIFLFLGDRYETFAAASAAVVLGIPLAHIHGGDKTQAGFDETYRHALTKLSNLHFAATQMSAERIKRMGENPLHVFNVGSPSLDVILNEELFNKKEIFKKYNLKENEKVILGIQHSVTSQISESRNQIKTTLSALEKIDAQVIFIYPNNDPGSLGIRQQLERANKINLYKNLPHKDYLSLLKHSDLLIGNSSSGIIDASGFGTPVINIGIRQNGRERGVNVIDTPHNKKKILEGILKGLYDLDFIKKARGTNSPYGDGKASERIANILSKIEIGGTQKQITY